jgi:thiamine biosynthesis lipoprotein
MAGFVLFDGTMPSVAGRTLLSVAIAGGLLALRFFPAAAHAGPNDLIQVQQTAMGTVWSIEVMDHGREAEARRAISAAFGEVERLEAMMSEWRPESPISQVDAAAGQHAVEVPAELREMLERSIVYSQKTEGTFDVTWRGMGNIWHFDNTFVKPNPAEVEKARRNIDYRVIQIRGNSIYLPEGRNIGLGGIAKGYAVDRVVELLAKAGFTDCLVNGGGDVRVSGTHDGNAWRLGVQNPRAERGRLLGVVKLTAGALSSSGDYERFVMVDGVRYHHIIDPRTGWPAAESQASTVIADTCERGVVLGKGVFILGSEKGMALARAEGIEALLVDQEGHVHMTPGFSKVFEAEQ